MTDVNSVDHLFEGKAPELRTTFEHLINALQQFGKIRITPKQTSIHLEKKGGFAGVHPRKTCLNLEFRVDYKIDDARISRIQQLSARCFEHTVKLEHASDVDEQLLKWLKDAYELSK